MNGNILMYNLSQNIDDRSVNFEIIGFEYNLSVD